MTAPFKLAQAVASNRIALNIEFSGKGGNRICEGLAAGFTQLKSWLGKLRKL